MAKKGAALAAITDDISVDEMAQASGGVIQHSSLPGLGRRWDPALAEAVSETAADDLASLPTSDFQDTPTVELRAETNDSTGDVALTGGNTSEDVAGDISKAINTVGNGAVGGVYKAADAVAGVLTNVFRGW